ncbi:uncharacterized, partial [Lates japonicus]
TPPPLVLPEFAVLSDLFIQYRVIQPASDFSMFAPFPLMHLSVQQHDWFGVARWGVLKEQQFSSAVGVMTWPIRLSMIVESLCCMKMVFESRTEVSRCYL